VEKPDAFEFCGALNEFRPEAAGMPRSSVFFRRTSVSSAQS